MTDYPWAYVGARVICVDAAENSLYGKNHLCRNAIYTIREVIAEPDGNGDIGVCLAEVASFSWRNAFRINRFRPLHTIESDVELFRAALTPTTEDIVYENALALLDEAERELEEAWANDR